MLVKNQYAYGIAIRIPHLGLQMCLEPEKAVSPIPVVSDVVRPEEGVHDADLVPIHLSRREVEHFMTFDRTGNVERIISNSPFLGRV